MSKSSGNASPSSPSAATCGVSALGAMLWKLCAYDADRRFALPPFLPFKLMVDFRTSGLPTTFKAEVWCRPIPIVIVSVASSARSTDRPSNVPVLMPPPSAASAVAALIVVRMWLLSCSQISIVAFVDESSREMYFRHEYFVKSMKEGWKEGRKEGRKKEGRWGVKNRSSNKGKRNGRWQM